MTARALSRHLSTTGTRHLAHEQAAKWLAQAIGDLTEDQRHAQYNFVAKRELGEYDVVALDREIETLIAYLAAHTVELRTAAFRGREVM